MAYSDILNTTALYGNLLNKNWANAGNRLDPTKFDDYSINPNSSGAFTPRSSRNIYDRPMNVTSDMAAFSDYDPWSGENLMMQGMKGLQYGQMGTTMSPYISDVVKFAQGPSAMQTVVNAAGDTMSISSGAIIPEGYKYQSGAGQMGDLGTAATIYGLTQNQNPYDFTKTERLGTMASTVMAARAVAPAIGAVGTGTATAALGMNPYLLVASLVIGHLWSKKKKKKAKRMRREAIEEFEGKQADIYAERSGAVQEMREDMLSEQQSRMYEQRQGQYANQYGGNYRDYMAEEGMKFSPKELKKIAGAGRNGDTQLAHINPQEAAILRAMGGSGTINPYTGLREYNWFRNLITGFGDVATGTLSGASDILDDIGVTPALSTGFGVAHDVVDPFADVAQEGVAYVGDEILSPIVEGVAEGATDIVKGVGHGALIPIFKAVGEPIGDILQGVIDLFGGGGDGEMSPYTEGVNPDIDRDPLVRDEQLSQRQLSGIKQKQLSGLQKRDKPTLEEGDWVGDKPNPYVTPNVEEELDYANKGMKYKYADGGQTDIVAEFTGNELIVNDQDKLEKALSNKNYSKAASSIRKAMKNKQLTPGPESHGGNPMPVDSKGNIYVGGGILPFKANKGAGIYDHATDQFKSTMTDKEIAMIAQSNINKWELNGMA